jgi:hypothetical protein
MLNGSDRWYNMRCIGHEILHVKKERSKTRINTTYCSTLKLLKCVAYVPEAGEVAHEKFTADYFCKD